MSLPGFKDYLEQIKQAGNCIPSQGWGIDEAILQEAARMGFACVVQGFLNYVHADTSYPEFMPGYDWAVNHMAPVPDYRYKVCLIDGAGTYRVSGFRGTSRFVDLTVFTSLFSLGRAGRVAARISLDDLSLGEDGWYEFILSAERPEGYAGDWYHLDPNAIRLQVRHACYDWLGEIDARMAVERLDVPARRPRPNAETIAAKLSNLATWTTNSLRFGIDHVQKQADKGVINKLEFIDWGAVGGFDPKIQTYYEGLFDLAEDDALILETDVPEKARYWSFLLADPLFGTIDFMNCQSSLNGFQARLDSDGKCRMVVCRQDPGVPNWLDTAGHAKGVIQVRWNECSSQPCPDARLVKLGELRGHLPSDTPTVSAAERDAVLRRRRLGAQMRNRW
jgi:hypothetical protein